MQNCTGENLNTPPPPHLRGLTEFFILESFWESKVVGKSPKLPFFIWFPRLPISLPYKQTSRAHLSEAKNINNIVALPQYALRVNILILTRMSDGVEWGRECEAARLDGAV